MQPVTDSSLVTKALLKAKGYRALERDTGVTRQVCWRLQSGGTVKLERTTRQRLLDYLNG